MKRIIKQFRLPFKSTSPDLKKKFPYEQMSTSNQKLCFSANHPKKTPAQKNGTKNHTETGPVIKKVIYSSFRGSCSKRNKKYKKKLSISKRSPKKTNSLKIS